MQEKKKKKEINVEIEKKATPATKATAMNQPTASG